MGSSLIIYAQIAIIAAGNQTETIGEVFPIMQTIVKKDVSLSIPKYEIPIEQPKQIVKKKLTWWQRILKIFGL